MINLTIQLSINGNIFHIFHIRWIGGRYYLPSTHRTKLSPIVKVGEYHRSITINISMMIHLNWVIVGCSIWLITKTKLVVTSLYEVTKGKIFKFYMGRIIMGWFALTKMVALSVSIRLTPIPFTSWENLNHHYVRIIEKLDCWWEAYDWIISIDESISNKSS